MNPYAAFLGDRDPVPVIRATPGRLSGLLETLGAAGCERALAPGKWSAREILCHLADCELVFAFRLRQALSEDRHVIQPFDQEKWAANYSSYRADEALSVFSWVRRWTLRLLEGAPAEAWPKMLHHPERGDMSFRVLVETMAGHDLNHLGQIETIAAASRDRR